MRFHKGAYFLEVVVVLFLLGANNVCAVSPKLYGFPLCSEERIGEMHKNLGSRAADIQDASLVRPILDFIDASKGPLVGCVYKLDHPLILDALKRKAASTSIRLLVESAPYQHPGSDDVTTNVQTLRSYGITVFEALPGEDPPQLHAKFLADSQRVLVTTQNWDVESFVGATGWRDEISKGDAPTRDALFIFDDPELAREANAKFEYLLNPQGQKPDHAFFVFGTLDKTREFIVDAIKSAKQGVQIYQQSIQDQGMISVLEGLLQSGKGVEIVMSEDPFHKGLKGKTDETGNLEKLVQKGARVSLIPSFQFPYIHEKAVIIDGEKVLVTTSNFYGPSLDRGLEISFLLEDAQIIHEMSKIFRYDFEKGMTMIS